MTGRLPHGLDTEDGRRTCDDVVRERHGTVCQGSAPCHDRGGAACQGAVLDGTAPHSTARPETPAQYGPARHRRARPGTARLSRFDPGRPPRKPCARPHRPRQNRRMPTDRWPLFNLRVRTPDLELRLPDQAEIAELADLAARGVHGPGERPFFAAWGDGSPEALGRTVLQRYWAALGGWQSDGWTLDLAAFLNGRPVGVQSMRGDDYGVLREIRSWSWLGIGHHGRGLGTQMRAGMLHLAFEGLGCESATSTSFLDNHASRGVTRKLGYREDGITRDTTDGQVFVSQRFRLTREDWTAVERPGYAISGLESCREWFGV